MVHHIEQSAESSIVEEPPFRVGPDSIQWGCAIAMVRSPIGFEIVNADFTSFVQVPARLAKDRLGVTPAALGLSAKEFIGTLCGLFVEAALRRLWEGSPVGKNGAQADLG